MKDTFFKKFISLILVFVLVLAIVPASVFADSGSDEQQAPDRTEKSETKISRGNTVKKGIFPGASFRVGDSFLKDNTMTSNENSYILAITLGQMSNVHIKEIIVSYYTDENVTSASVGNKVPFKQVLEVERLERENYYSSNTGDAKTALDSIWQWNSQYNWKYYGSKYGTYFGLFQSSKYTYNNIQGTTAEKYTLTKNFDSYSQVAGQIVDGLDTDKYPDASIKSGSRTITTGGVSSIFGAHEQYINDRAQAVVETEAVPLQASTTEYLRFMPQYNFGTLESISFVCAQEEGGGMSSEIQIFGWQLWQVDNNKPNVIATNYSYFSDSLGLTFDGTLLFESQVTGSALGSTQFLLTQNGVLRYFNQDILPTCFNSDTLEFNVTELDATEKAKLDVYKSDVLGGLLDLLTCKKVKDSDPRRTASPTIDAYDFVITFADQYGAGLEQFNVSPMSDVTIYETGQKSNTAGILNLADVLTATIEYTNNYGRKEEVTLPIISNSILNMAPEAIEVLSTYDFLASDFVKKIQSGDIIQYAQQGDSISFRVEFPNFKELNSISIKYFDGLAGDSDEVGIESVAVYRGFRLKDSTKPASSSGSVVDTSEEKKVGLVDRLCSLIGIEKNELSDILLTQANKLKITKAIQIAGSDSSSEVVPIKEGSDTSQDATKEIYNSPGHKASEPKSLVTPGEQQTIESIQKTFLNVSSTALRLPNSYYTYTFGNGKMSALPTDGFLVYKGDNNSIKWLSNDEPATKINFVKLDPDDNNTLTLGTDETVDTYLVLMTTSNMTVASTNAEAYVKFTYQNTSKQDKETAEYSIKELCKDYMGYQTGVVIEDTRSSGVSIATTKDKDDASDSTDTTVNALTRIFNLLSPGAIFNNDDADTTSTSDVSTDTVSIVVDQGVPLSTSHAIDVSYQYGVQAGNTIGFTFTAKNVAQFTGIEIRINGSEDDWQISNLSIKKVTNMSKRTLHVLSPNTMCENTSEDGTVVFVTNRRYTRDVQGETVYEGTNLDFLIQRNGESSLNLVSGARTGSTKMREDYSDYEEYMPYIIASSDLKFDTSVQNYEVVVHVGNDANGKDNCGSNNMYYFQLEFEDGSRSAYVLANKQLAADGFRTGVDESFMISCNEDHGNVVSVTIIPDDTTSNADPLDKLCIDSLDVIKRNQNSPNKRFVVENVGWIGTAYVDTNDTTEKETRSESEMAYNYAVNHSAYVVSLEIAVSYGNAVNKVTAMTGGDGEVDPQYQGDMTCDISYITSSGESKFKSEIQMVKLMYDYMNRTAPISSTNDTYISNPNFMFRPNTTDRFIVDIEDCQKIEAIVFHATPEQTTTLTINQINIWALRQQGTLALRQNSDGSSDYSYYRKYDKGLEPTNVGSTDSELGAARTLVAGQVNKFSYYINGSEFPDFEQEETYDYIVESTPASGKDTFNIYFFLEKGTPTPQKGNYEFVGGIKYRTVDGKTYESRASSRDGDYTVMEIDGSTVLCAKALPASNYDNMMNIWAMATDDITSEYKIVKAIVQQVRAGVTINTLNYSFGSGKFSQKGGTTSSSNTTLKTADYGTQTVKIQLSTGTGIVKSGETATAIQNVNLIKGKLDIGVSLIYTTNDLGGGEYTSPITFATDNGTASIHEGSVLEFNFNEYDVKEILGVKIQCAGTSETGYLDLHIGDGETGGINIICTEDNGATQTGWYSISPGKNLKLGQNKVLLVTGNWQTNWDDISKIKKIDVEFTTASSGTNAFEKVKATFVYNSKNGTKTVVIDDLSKYISTEKVTSLSTFGETSKISLMIPGYVSMRNIKLEVQGESAQWTLGGVKITDEDTGYGDNTTWESVSAESWKIETGKPVTIEITNTITNN